MPRIIGELMLKNLASQWLPGDQLYWEGGPFESWQLREFGSLSLLIGQC